MTTARRRGLRVQHRCTEVNLAIGLGWIETRMASPARSSRGPLMPTIESGGGERVSTRSMCVVRNVQALRTMHIGWELPVGLRLRRHRRRRLGWWNDLMERVLHKVNVSG